MGTHWIQRRKGFLKKLQAIQNIPEELLDDV